MSRPTLHVVLGVLVLFGTASGVAVSADSGDTLSVSPAVEVPDQTVSFRGNSYTITAFGRVRLGETVSVTATVESEGQYYVTLFNGDGQRIVSKSARENTTMRFDTDVLREPGTYTFALEQDGTFERIHPLVVPAYGVSVDAPTEVTKGADVSVDATLSEIEPNETVESVELVVANNETSRRLDMRSTGSMAYERDVDTDDLPIGEYQVYAVVRGTETVNGNNEAIGVSDTRTLSVRPESTPTQTSSPGGGQGGSGAAGGGGGAGAPVSGATPTSAETETETSISSPTATTPPTPTIRSPTAVSTVPTTDRPTNDPPATVPTTTAGGVIQPNTASEASSSAVETRATTGMGLLGAFPLFWGALLTALGALARTR